MFIEKGNRGYLNRKKIVYSIFVILLMAVIVFFFVMSSLKSGTASAIYKVMAILTVLPLANLLTLIIACFPYKQPEQSEYDEIAGIVGDGVFSTECAVTNSSMKTIYLKYVYVCKAGVICLAEDTYGKTADYEKYIEGMLAANFVQLKVQIMTDPKKYIKRLHDFPIEKREDADGPYLKAEATIRSISI